VRQRTLAIGAGQGLRGRYGSGGLGRACSVGFGFGDAAEGDLEAGGSELADGHLYPGEMDRYADRLDEAATEGDAAKMRPDEDTGETDPEEPGC
jgi:hypothetical protein